MYEQWCKLLDAVPERDVALDAELQRQQQNEDLRVQFSQIANEIGAYIETRSSALAELSMQGKDTMEDQLVAVKAFQAETMSYQPKIDEAEAANQVRVWGKRERKAVVLFPATLPAPVRDEGGGGRYSHIASCSQVLGASGGINRRERERMGVALTVLGRIDTVRNACPIGVPGHISG